MQEIIYSLRYISQPFTMHLSICYFKPVALLRLYFSILYEVVFRIVIFTADGNSQASILLTALVLNYTPLPL